MRPQWGRRMMCAGALAAIALIVAAVPDPGCAAQQGREALQFLPWAFPLPVPEPVVQAPLTGTPPFLPPPASVDGTGWAVVSSPPGDDLARAIALLQQAVSRLTNWITAAQSAAADALSRLIAISPGFLPGGGRTTDLLAQVRALPAMLRTVLESVLAKLQTAAAPGSTDERHAVYVSASPVLMNEASGIAAADQIIAEGSVQHAVSTDVTAAAATAAADDIGLPAAVAAAHETGAALASGAHDLPSARAGIELLVAGMGAGLAQQADLGAAVADRMTLVARQAAELSRQIAALAGPIGVLAARDAERDRQAMEARLGFADAVEAGGRLLGAMLAGAAGTPGSELHLDPLY